MTRDDAATSRTRSATAERASSGRSGVLESVLVNLFIWLISFSYAFLDWDIFRAKYLAHPDGWKLYFSGGIEAPWQYRIGVWEVVKWLDRWFHVKPYDTLTLVDVLCLALSLWAVLRVLRNFQVFKTASAPVRWLGIATVFFLAEYYVLWGHWFQTEDTLPSVLFVTLSLALVYGEIIRSRALACCLLVCLGGIQGFIRADVAVVLHAGFALAILLNRKISIPLGRGRQIVTSLLTALVAGCVQLYLMCIRFPNAKYGPEGVFQLVNNLHPGMWLTMILALFPYWLLLGFLVKQRYQLDGVEVLLLTSSLLYLAVWATVGQLDEVRIFLPFLFGMMPATARVLMRLSTMDAVQPE